MSNPEAQVVELDTEDAGRLDALVDELTNIRFVLTVLARAALLIGKSGKSDKAVARYKALWDILDVVESDLDDGDEDE